MVKNAQFDSSFDASLAGTQHAFRWVNRTLVPALVLVCITSLAILGLQGIVFGKWPAVNQLHFWFVATLYALILAGIYFVTCLLASVATAIAFRIRHALSPKPKILGSRNISSQQSRSRQFTKVPSLANLLNTMFSWVVVATILYYIVIALALGER